MQWAGIPILLPQLYKEVKYLQLEVFGQFMASYGFPIAACVAMAWYVKYITDKHTIELAEVHEKHKAEMTSVTDALNNNTLVLRELKTLLEVAVKHDS